MKSRYFTRKAGTLHEKQVLYMKSRYFTRKAGTLHEKQVLYTKSIVHL